MDPSGGVKLNITVSLINGRTLHFSDFEEMSEADFKRIKSIKISNNGVKTQMDSSLLDKLFNHTPHLYYLTIDDNVHIKELPKIENDNNSLIYLVLSGNQLQEIPEDFAKLKALKSFRCLRNEISSLPKGFAGLKSLKTLMVAGNNFKEFPKEILELHALERLQFNEEFGVLPVGISNLERLLKLSVSSASLSSLPESLKEMKNLVTIDLPYNEFTKLPDPLKEMENISRVDLGHNPLNKEELAASLEGFQGEELILFTTLNESDRLELSELFPEIKFRKSAMYLY